VRNISPFDDFQGALSSQDFEVNPPSAKNLARLNRFFLLDHALAHDAEKTWEWKLPIV
jgi:hypothetical protein